jgi:predicted permease
VTGWLEACLKDIAFAFRQMRKGPGFAVVAILSLALGIGANTAIFTLIESTLLRPIAVKNPERLRLLTWKEQHGGWVPPNLGFVSPTFGAFYEQRETPDGGLLHTDFTPRMYREFRRTNNVFESLFAFKELGRVTAVADGTAEALNCFLVAGDFYRGMEVAPVIGRAIGPADDVAGPESSVVVISYRYWTERFARNPSVIGKTITLNDVPVTIIGVNPEYFTGIEPGAHFEIWAPLHLSPAVYGYLQHGADFKSPSQLSILDELDAWSLPMMGRLKPGVSDAQAQSAVDALFQTQVDANPGPLPSFLKEPAKRPRFLLQSAERGIDYLTERYDRLLLAVFGLAGLVLLIACANVANLLLAKSAVRQREISLKLALGARRGRIARQLLVEGLLLAAMAGLAGLVLGYWSRNAIPALLSTSWRPSPFDTAFDPKVLLVSIAIAFLAGVLFSLAPIWQLRRVEVNDALKEGSRGTASLSKLRLGRSLVVLQVALCVLLLAGATLCIRTFTNLRNLPLGFQPEGLLLFTVDPPAVRYPAARLPTLLTNLQEQLKAIPGVQSATFSGNGGFGSWTMPSGHMVNATRIGAGSDFLESMGVPILYGRAIGAHESPNGPQAVVVNEKLAGEVYPGQNPIGKIFRGPGNGIYQVVGVCANWHSEHLQAQGRLTPRYPVWAAFYGAFVQAPYTGRVIFELKIAGGQAGVVRQIRQLVRSLDPNLTVTDVRTEEQQIEDALSEERFMASLAAIFGGLALLLASIGLYGVMAYTVARRTNEIGIRVALGAQPGSVARMVLRETLLLAALGIAIGVPLVLGANPVLDHFLGTAWQNGFAYGVKPNDPLVLALTVLVLAAASFFAGYLPARRAARVDPIMALRHD